MNRELIDRLQQATGLPSPPGLALRLLEPVDCPQEEVARFCEAASADPALSAWLLKFSNSKMLDRAVPVGCVPDAVSRIGLRAARVVSLSLLLVSCEGDDAGVFAVLGGVWRRALARAIASRRLASLVGQRRPGELAQLATLAEVSMVALWRVDRAACGLIAGDEYTGPAAHGAQEERTLGCSVWRASAELMKAWRLPRRMCSAMMIADGQPCADGIDCSPASQRMAEHLRLAERVACSLLGRAPAPGAGEAAAVAGREVGGEAWESALAACREDWEAARPLVLPPLDALGAAREVERLTRVTLAELSLATQLENRMMKRRQEELLQRVTTDALTGVKNRLAFDERLEEEVERAQRSGRPMALFMCDLDGFKAFNDRHGHQAGDLMLRSAAESLAQAARRVDLVARYGGEEFGVIAPQCGYEGAVILAERLRKAVEELSIDWRGQTLRTTISIGGVVAAGGAQGRHPGELVAAADRQLYAAKAAGRNRCLVEAEEAAPRVVGG